MALKEATFGMGCFWCTEAIFSNLEGVIAIHPGYAGGHIKNPSYKEVCSGRTGHIEVSRITYDDTIVSFEKLLEVFWYMHDPTSIDKQGNDIGEQYKSIVFYHDEEQKELTEKYKERINHLGVYDKPIVTEIRPLTTYYPAEENHKAYFDNNPDQPYCAMVIRPKVEKFQKIFGKK
ncbi:MAG: peptide-methionine (S)-S-oxide reductase MsrA [Brumimicrobium sp.]|nr:peptide-methionine (S)-S-oxide reductase MsrA [Brumimicrobium sp.]